MKDVEYVSPKRALCETCLKMVYVNELHTCYDACKGKSLATIEAIKCHELTEQACFDNQKYMLYGEIMNESTACYREIVFGFYNVFGVKV